MTNVRCDERRLEILEARHFAADDRWLAKREKAEAQIEKFGLIGQLCREGKTVYYICLQDRNGNLTGKTKEGGEVELISYLIRNHYV